MSDKKKKEVKISALLVIYFYLFVIYLFDLLSFFTTNYDLSDDLDSYQDL